MIKIEVDDAAVIARLEKMIKSSDGKSEDMVKELGDMVLDSAKRYVPVDTGELKESITISIGSAGDGSEAEISATADHAAAIEYGTSRSRSQPYLRPALRDAEAAIQKVFKAVWAE